MRALCEACGHPQPPDWSPGDQCVQCGKAVRRELRCFWCVKWTPAAKFCRSCGAETVEPRVYGAARMLKDAGTDRFTVPKQLREFDPDQIENFTRIYQRHAVAVARHVDEVRFLEKFLRQRPWSGALEEQLVVQLPWPEDTLAKMSSPALPPGDDLATAKAIGETSPFTTTRALAALVRLRLDDWSAYKSAASVFHASDPALRAEAALVLTGWRVLNGWGRPRDDGRAIYEELQKSPFKREAVVRMASLAAQVDESLLRDAAGSDDPETAFAAALVLGDVDVLQAALKGGELEKIAAGNKLIAMGVIKPVVETVEKSPIEVQRELVESLVRQKGAAPEAAETLLQIVETTEDATLRERAARVLCRQIRPGWVLRIAKAAKGDRHIFQSLLQAETLPPEGAVELGDFLIAGGHFSMGQYGMSTLAEKARMPFTFVPSRFGAADEKTQGEMLRFAETQLEHGGDEPLHRFVMNVAWGPHPAKIRAAAWWVLHRWYRQQGEYRGEGPFKLEPALIERFFGSTAAFIPRLTAVLRDHDTLKEVGYFEMIANVLVSADDAAVAAFQKDGGALLEALLEGARGDYWPNTVEAMVRLAARVGATEAWRERTLDALRALGKKGNYHYDKAVRGLELSAYGLPDENAWKDLPPDFVPSRWRDATPQARAEFLKVVDQQLIYKNGDGLGRFLLLIALGGEVQAMDIYEDRIRETVKPRRSACAFYDELVAALPAALRGTDDGKTIQFLQELFRDPKPEDVEAGDAGRALIDAMLARAAMTGSPNLSRAVVGHLAVSGTHPSWREDVRRGLERLGPDGERALREFPPPEVKASAASLAKEHQEKIFRLMAGPGTLEHKKREAGRLKAEYQAKLKDL